MRVVCLFLVALPLASAGLVEDLTPLLGEHRTEQLQRHVAPLEVELRAMLKALPKTSHGCLAAARARYALHRLFVEKGWFVKGLQDLDPSRAIGQSNSSSPVVILQDQVPMGVKSIFEEKLERTGLCLNDLATLAGLLEDLVHRETMQRVSAAFKAKKVPLVSRVSVKNLADMLDYVMMSYILEVASLDGTKMEEDVSVYLNGKRPMEEIYPNWPKTQKFLRDIQGVVAPAKRGSLSFEEITHVVEEINEHYGRWHDEVDCQDMKNVLFGMERCPGRVDLSRFYAASLYEDKWQFSESVRYLRDLGTLDVTNPSMPSVVVSNYVLGASNCIGTSRYYAQCCVDPCDELMAKLEKALATPAAPPSTVAAAVQAVLPQTGPLTHHLEEIAHDGLVVIHGRLFAQWLHQAYPRECPMPPVTGLRLQQELPKDFSLRTGEDYVATEKEMRRYAPKRPSEKEQKDLEDGCKMPWTTDEELLDNVEHKDGLQSPYIMIVGAVSIMSFAVAMLVRFGLRKRNTPARGPLLATEASQVAPTV